MRRRASLELLPSGAVRRFARAAAACVFLACAAALSAGCGSGKAYHGPGVFVLGVDGMDPGILGREMSAGHMPNFERLSREGGFSPLATVLPAESPVAWTSFATGTNPGTHGAFAFVDRELTKTGFKPADGMSKLVAPSDWIPLFGYRIPLIGGRYERRRSVPPFWDRLHDAGVPVSIMRLPADFPATGERVRTLSGLGTPGMDGLISNFTYYTNAADYTAVWAGMGTIRSIREEDGAVHTKLDGPPNEFLPAAGDGQHPSRASIPVSIYPDEERHAARLVFGDQSCVVAVGEWSPWIPVTFTLVPHLVTVHGMVRAYLRFLSPTIGLYVSPVNADPLDPDLPICWPKDLSRRLAKKIGRFPTVGFPVAFHAYGSEVLDTKEFLSQVDQVHGFEDRLLGEELSRFRRVGGFAFFYVSTIDTSCHMLWRFYDKTEPGYNPKLAREYGGEIPRLYRQVDAMLGEVMREVPRGTRIVVMSDHGFAPQRENVSLNSMLADHGYFTRSWKTTRAYSVGSTGIYLNLEGREPSGAVKPGRQADHVEDEIIGLLQGWIDPRSGRHVVDKVYRSKNVYRGSQRSKGPDLIVGFNRGFDCLANNAGLPALVMNTYPRWSGNHVIDPPQVPGILAVNARVRLPHPGLEDLAPTILAEYGMSGKGLDGRLIWKAHGSARTVVKVSNR